MKGTGETNDTAGSWRRELAILAGFVALFLGLFFVPVGIARFDNALKEGLELTNFHRDALRSDVSKLTHNKIEL